MIPVTYRQNIFRPLDDVKTFKVAPGLTLLQIVQQISDMPDDFIVCVNGQQVDRQLWGLVRPKPSSERVPVIVTLHPMPHGGKLSTILTVLAVVAIIAATAVSLGALGPGGLALLGPSFAAGGFGATATAAGLSLVSSLALAGAALTAPPITPNLGGGQDAKTIAGVSGNTINPGDYLPMVLGKMRISPPPLAPPFSTYENGDVFINGIVGLAGAYLIENIWLNGSPIELFEDVTYSSRQGLASDSAPSQNFTYSVQEQQPHLKLSQYKLDPDTVNLQTRLTVPADSYSDWHIFNVPPPGDDGKVVLRLHWPTGMNVIDNDDSIDAGALPIRIEIRPRSQAAGTWYKLPELHFRQKQEHNAELRQQITLQWGTPAAGTLTISTTSTAWSAWYKSAPGSAFERTAEAIYNPGAVNTARRVSRDGVDGFIIEIDNTAMDGDEEYDIRVRAGMPFKQAGFNASTTAAWTHDSDSSEGEAFFDHDTNNTATSVTKGGSAAGFVYVESIASFMVAEPFDWHGLASIAFKAKGIHIDSLSAEFTSIVPLWDGQSWSNSNPTVNPAALYRFVMTTLDYNSQPIPGEIVDESNLVEWFEQCVNMQYECNVSIQNQSLPSVLQLIASAGWASPKYTELWGVVMERSRIGEEITQLLTPLNSKDLGSTKEFPKLPHALRAEYFSAVDAYQMHDDVVVYAPGYDANTAVIYESIRYDGITDADKVLTRAQFDINQLYLRSVRYTRDVHHEGFLCPRGALIGLADEVVERAHRFAMITEVITDTSGAVVGFGLETLLDLNALSTEIWDVSDPFALPDPFHPTGHQFGISIRLNDGSPSTHLVDGSVIGDTVLLATPVLNTGNLFERGQIASLGPSGYEYKRMIVMSVEPHQGGDVFRLTLADERPDLHE